MKSQRSFDVGRLFVGLWAIVTLSGALGVLATPSIAFGQGFWSDPPQWCEAQNDRGYGQVCDGPYAYFNDGGVLINFNDGGECCEGICGGTTEYCEDLSPDLQCLRYQSYPICCGTDGDPSFPGQSALCASKPWWSSLCVTTAGPGFLVDFLCCSGAAVWAPYDAGVACQCIQNGDSPGLDSQGNPINTDWACCSNQIRYNAGTQAWVCAPAPEFHPCQSRLGCADIDGADPACYKPPGAQFGICIPPTLCNGLNNLPDSGIPNCNQVPCCGNEACNSETGQCYPQPPCLLPDSGHCQLNALTEPCCGPNYDGGVIVGHQADGGWGYTCNPTSLTCVPAIGPDGGKCGGDSTIDGGADPNFLEDTGEGNCMQGMACYNPGSSIFSECEPIHPGQCCSSHQHRTECEFPLSCEAVPPATGGLPDGGGGSGCSNYEWDPEAATCCKPDTGGWYSIPGTDPQCDPADPWECCSGNCIFNPSTYFGHPADTCDGIAWPLCAPYGFKCSVQSDCCPDAGLGCFIEPGHGSGGCVDAG